jgi:uncharacterized protein YlxW (UPF0749 family)
MPERPRALSLFPRNRHGRRPLGGMVVVFVVLVVAGMLFATSATVSDGSGLRADSSDTIGLLRAQQERQDERADRVRRLREEIEALTDAAAGTDSRVALLQRQAQVLAESAGMREVTGPGLQITLDDAPRNSPLTAGAQVEDIVVHQQDVQAVVNALWAGGAEAMQLMDQRVISTSAVRCVGNTLILQGRVYSPPYRITAIGPVDDMRAAVDASPSISIYRGYVDAFGLGWQLRELGTVTVPGYDGSLHLLYATVPESAEKSPDPRAGQGSPTSPSGF